MIAIGLFMFVSSILKSDFVIYRFMVARSRLLWGNNVHKFYQFVGAIIIVFGFLVTIGIID